MICEIENENVLSKTYLPNTFTGHAKEAHDNAKHTHHHAENEKHKHHQHSHSGILNAIGDCDGVVAWGNAFTMTFHNTTSKYLLPKKRTLIRL